MSDCHWHLGRPNTARRFLMLTLIEDVVANKGKILRRCMDRIFEPWIFGLSDRLWVTFACGSTLYLLPQFGRLLYAHERTKPIANFLFSIVGTQFDFFSGGRVAHNAVRTVSNLAPFEPRKR